MAIVINLFLSICVSLAASRYFYSALRLFPSFLFHTPNFSRLPPLFAPAQLIQFFALIFSFHVSLFCSALPLLCSSLLFSISIAHNMPDTEASILEVWGVVTPFRFWAGGLGGRRVLDGS